MASSMRALEPAGASSARARGRAEVVVGLCIERSLAMQVGLLGILKAGGAYLPLDPDYPPRRWRSCSPMPAPRCCSPADLAKFPLEYGFRAPRTAHLQSYLGDLRRSGS